MGSSLEINPFDEWQEHAVQEITGQARYVSRGAQMRGCGVVRLVVNENKIGLDVAAAVTTSFAGRRMIEISPRRQQIDYLHQLGVQFPAPANRRCNCMNLPGTLGMSVFGAIGSPPLCETRKLTTGARCARRR
jgi:hypothetical protein